MSFGGFSFGSSTTSAANVTPAAPPAFGASSVIQPATQFSFGSAGGQSAVQPKPLFGATAASVAPSLFGGVTTTSQSSLFGNTTPLTGVASSTLSTTSQTLFGSGTTPLFGSTTTQASSALPTFGIASSASKTTTITSTTASTSLFSAAAPQTQGFGSSTSLFGTSSTTTLGANSASTTSVKVNEVKSGSSLFGGISTPPTTTSATKVGDVGFSGLSSVSGSSDSASRMKFSELDEAINRWSVEVQDLERKFIHQSTQINAWDRLLVNNGAKLAELEESVNGLTLEQERLDQELDFVTSEQNEMEKNIAKLEAAVGINSSAASAVTPGGPPSFMNVNTPADIERRQTFEAAKTVDLDLRRMADELRELISFVNSRQSSERDRKADEISTILDSHVESLEWIERASSSARTRLDAISKAISIQ